MGSAAYGSGNDKLLMAAGCVGCHAHTPNNDATGYAPTGISAPQVIAPAGAGMLAGGYFSNTDNGHNVAELIAVGQQVADTVFIAGNAPGSVGNPFPIASPLSCDTATGCHETAGAHHANTVGNPGATNAGDSFRFLNARLAGGYVTGTEGVNYGVDPTDVANSNRYTSTGVTGVGAQVCAQCHGDFHGNANQLNTAGAGQLAVWGLHPTDIQVDNNLLISGETYNAGNGYNPAIPMGGMTNTDTTTGNVICLSCHMSHGSANPDLLRWDYTTMVAGTGYTGAAIGSAAEGCFICHNSK